MLFRGGGGYTIIGPFAVFGFPKSQVLGSRAGRAYLDNLSEEKRSFLVVGATVICLCMHEWMHN